GNPIHSTGVGLLLYGSKQDNVRTPIAAPGSGTDGVLGRVMQWIKGEF
ncbi:MAG: cell division protein FtsA, partial [Proteobacteria bacterium]|nr:cell division protein FtsA [Pseudomonadota bacterium]